MSIAPNTAPTQVLQPVFILPIYTGFAARLFYPGSQPAAVQSAADFLLQTALRHGKCYTRRCQKNSLTNREENMDKKKKEDLAGGCDLKVTAQKGKKGQKWVKPELTDVSGRVMAQPYIRFT